MTSASSNRLLALLLAATAPAVEGASTCRDIRDFGASETSPDNTAAIQAAIDQAPCVLVPEGTFTFRGSLTLAKNQIVQGEGARSVLRYAGIGAAMREPTGVYSPSGYSNIKLRDFKLEAAGTARSGIELVNNYQVQITGLVLDGQWHGFTQGAIHLKGDLPPGNSAVIRITDNEIWSSAGDGIRVSGTGGVASLWIERNHVTANLGWGIGITVPGPPYPATELYAIDNTIEGNVAGGLNADVLYAARISGNHFENSLGSSATLVRLGGNGFVQGVSIQDNVFGGQAAAHAVDCPLGEVRGIVANNTFAGASVAAVRLARARGVSFLGNTLDGVTATELVTYGAGAQSIWIQDEEGITYVGGTSGPPPTIRSQGGFRLGSAAGPVIVSGAAAPVGTCVTGSLYLRTGGGPGTPALHSCEGGAWVAVRQGSPPGAAAEGP